MVTNFRSIKTENIDQIDKLKSANNTESKVNFLRAVKLLNDNNRAKYINDVEQSLLSKSEEERLEAVKTLHFLLPYEKEKIIFKDFVINEKSDMVKTQISYYIGGIK